MSLKNTYQTYGSVSKFLHWTIVVLVIAMLIYGFVLDYVPESWQGVGYNIHKLVGLLILLIMLIRTVWALRNPKPKLPSKTPLWEIAAMRFTHFAFYIVLLAMPIAGWVLASAAGRPPKLFGFAISLPIAKNDVVRNMAGEIHEILAFVIIAMIVLHVVAAMKHHYINKNDVFRRMLPGNVARRVQ